MFESKKEKKKSVRENENIFIKKKNRAKLNEKQIACT